VAPDFEVVLSLRDLTKRVLSDQSAVEGAKSVLRQKKSKKQNA
jgi:hypothetical protein